ncbi:MAG TPA: helix-turn-helix domain-containing protein [Sinomonas sp.]|nr:helix-turn-helix domain-containing protein [Sinomonas sp.]
MSEVPGRRERQRLHMRRRLLEAALSLFEAQGFESTTIDEIAERADVARQTVLNHYPAKRDFVLAWGERRRQEAADADVPASGPTRERLHRIYDVLAQINERERRLTRMLRAQMVVPQPIPPALTAALDDGAATGELLDGVTPQDVAEILAAVYFDTQNRWLLEEPAGFDLKAALSRKLDLILRQLTGG